METTRRSRGLRGKHESIIIHFDYDCFYASVFEAARPELKFQSLGVAQKQILVTVNYEARRRGLHKLQLISEAKKICPDVVIISGEDLTEFRNASKELYTFLRSFSWNDKVERLGFDELFLDVSDLIEHNFSLLNRNDLRNSFFCLSRTDPTTGFDFDASYVAGNTWPACSTDALLLNTSQLDALRLKLHLGSHLAQFLRKELEERKGFTSSVGIAPSKLLSKLVGNLNKPKGQTTLMPPYDLDGVAPSNITSFIDEHPIGKIPGIGCKLARKIREFILQEPIGIDDELSYGAPKKEVLVKDVRLHPNMNVETLEMLLGGPGVPRGIGEKIWGLMHGVDDTNVSKARDLPKQISIEDSYTRLDNFREALAELHMLARSLINRMHIDLLEDELEHLSPDDADVNVIQPISDSILRKKKRWLAHPKTLRLSTRPRPPLNSDGARSRTFNRISRSAPTPNFLFSLTEKTDVLVERLVTEALVPLFRKLHPEKSRWNLSLVNIAVTNMVDSASDTRNSMGRDISKMFKGQDEFFRQRRVQDRSAPPGTYTEEEVGREPTPVSDIDRAVPVAHRGSEDILPLSQDSTVSRDDDEWLFDGNTVYKNLTFVCDTCGATMPTFAMLAHCRWHLEE
ncbi:DNA/RNA polymerase [Glonium stellatum]|uniref:DNA/RNA polymerase n=1 Tax=Glonium stellatum TaxID=574774 RepID=A0A8E2EQY8_9PEZI|nr:DNA/RNA polymerase [Glonium stellatum]